MREMVNCMDQWFDEPRHNVVAAMTNIAFPDADVVAEECPFGLQADDAASPPEAVHSTNQMI